jgi:hypothetical protein
MHTQAQGVPMISDIKSLKWKNRVVIVYETKNQDESLQLLKKQAADINYRDIIWFIIKDDNIHTNYSGTLSSEFARNIRVKSGSLKSKVILIGKDGGIKSRSDYLNLNAIFSKIDTLPMRQFEMNQ